MENKNVGCKEDGLADACYVLMLINEYNGKPSRFTVFQ